MHGVTFFMLVDEKERKKAPVENGNAAAVCWTIVSINARTAIGVAASCSNRAA
jgi:hypothetical protein